MVSTVFAQSTIFQYPLGILLFLVSLFLILLILVQRGRGGGLTGALGGMGGQSAFGSKAGDVFTKITVITASVWILLCLLIIAIYDVGGFAPTRGAGRRAAERGPDNESLQPPGADATGESTGGGFDTGGGAQTATDGGSSEATTPE